MSNHRVHLALKERHLVYGGGPPCNPYCPGTWSAYHEGYADGYERAAIVAFSGRGSGAEDPMVSILHEARCGPESAEHLPWTNDHHEWDVATVKALRLLGVHFGDGR